MIALIKISRKQHIEKSVVKLEFVDFDLTIEDMKKIKNTLGGTKHFEIIITEQGCTSM